MNRCTICNGYLYEDRELPHHCLGSKPWENEPESLDFVSSGLQCALRRNGFKSWCGYVKIEKNHPLFGVEYSQKCPTLKPLLDKMMNEPLPVNHGFALDISILFGGMEPTPEIVFKVHGGITYSRDHDPYGTSSPNEWWFGFDCSHAGDWNPDMGGYGGDTYKDINYAKEQTESLAKQLASISQGCLFNKRF